MFWSQRTSEILIEQEIVQQLKMLKTHTSGSEEYAKILENISKLNGMQKKASISKETIATVAANLVGILMILRYEAADNIIRSKALGLVTRLK